MEFNINLKINVSDEWMKVQYNKNKIENSQMTQKEMENYIIKVLSNCGFDLVESKQV